MAAPLTVQLLAAELESCGSCGCPTELAAWEHELRDRRGRWTESPGGGLSMARVGATVRLPNGDEARILAVGPPTMREGFVHVVVPGKGASVYQAHELGLAAKPQAPAGPAEAFEFMAPGDTPGAAFLPGNREPEIGDWARSEGNVVGKVVGKAGGHAVVEADDGNRYLVDWRNGGEVRQAGPVGEPMRRRTPRSASPPGEYVAPGTKQLLFPGMPEPRTEFGHGSDPVKRLRQLSPAVATAIAGDATGNMLTDAGSWRREEGTASVSRPKQGQQGQVAVVRLPDGTQVVSKTQDAKRQDREELAYYVAQVMGVDAPAVARISERETLQDYVPGGKTMARWLDEINSAVLRDEDVDDPSMVLEEAESEMYYGNDDIGLFDFVTGNGDRHVENVMITEGDIAVPIDHGMAFNVEWGTDSPFWSYGEDTEEMGAGWDAQQVADMRTRLAKIEPEFARLGRMGWYQEMLDRVDMLQGPS